MGIKSLSFSQVISGKVVNELNKKTIPFVSIGIKGTNIGTVSNEDGYFHLNLENMNLADSLKISAIGYKFKTFSASKAQSFSDEIIYLQSENYNLKEVTILPSKTIKKVLGNKKYNKNGYCSFGSKAKGTQVALKIENKTGRSLFIEDFNFCLNINAFGDSILFRLNFYDEDINGLPGESLLKNQIVFSPKPNIGISTLDLKEESIIIDEKVFFVSLECISDITNKYKSKYTFTGIGFSGSPKGPIYLKTASQSNWQKSPIAGVDFNVTVSYQK